MGWHCEECGGDLRTDDGCYVCALSKDLAEIREAALAVFEADIKYEWQIKSSRAAERFKRLQVAVEGCYQTNPTTQTEAKT